MYNKLIQYFMNIMPLNTDEVEGILATMNVQRFAKGTLLLKEGQISAEAYFVLKGCVRQYYIVDGEERTSNFFTEAQWVISLNSSNQGVPSRHFMACCEDSELVVGNSSKAEELYRKFPRLESVSRKVMEKVFAEQQELMGNYFTDTPEQRYRKLMETRPTLLQRIPQYHIASYVGVKPESLSRIRKRILTK